MVSAQDSNSSWISAISWLALEEGPVCVLGSSTCGNALRLGEQVERSPEAMEHTRSVRWIPTSPRALCRS